MKSMKQMLKEVAGFLYAHRWHMLAAIPALVGVTVLHELAHCIAVWVQGGSVTEFVWLPAGSEWGHMSYSFPPRVDYNETFVSLGPYGLWMSCVLLAAMLSFRRTPWRFRYASSIYVWLFIVPVGDIANAALPYLLWSVDNDLHEAFGPVRALSSGIAAIVAALVVAGGYWMNRRLYRERALGPLAYGVLVALGFSAVFGLTAMAGL